MDRKYTREATILISCTATSIFYNDPSNLQSFLRNDECRIWMHLVIGQNVVLHMFLHLLVSTS